MITGLISIFAADACDKSGGFFGFVPWYHYLQVNPGTCEVTNFTLLGNGKNSDIPLILLAVIDDLLRLAGMIAVAFIIYGGIQFVASRGNSEKTARAQSTVLNALTGLAVTVIAVAFVSFLGSKLGG